jgi:hypothetical protein
MPTTNKDQRPADFLRVADPPAREAVSRSKETVSAAP